jgi:hypothetical protein
MTMKVKDSKVKTEEAERRKSGCLRKLRIRYEIKVFTTYLFCAGTGT